MNILSNIIRGGQLSLHAIRMFKQVLHLLILWATFVTLILFGMGLHESTTFEQWRGYRDYQLANMLNSIMMSNKRITVYFGD